jgi:outer membrane protein OmpA-like peptidoglycan-associated protein
MFSSLQSEELRSSSRGRVVAFVVFVLCGFLLLSCSKHDKKPISNETGGPQAKSLTPPPAAPQETTTVAEAQPASLPVSAVPETVSPPSTAAPAFDARVLAKRRKPINTDETGGTKASVPPAASSQEEVVVASAKPAATNAWAQAAASPQEADRSRQMTIRPDEHAYLYSRKSQSPVKHGYISASREARARPAASAGAFGAAGISGVDEYKPTFQTKISFAPSETALSPDAQKELDRVTTEASAHQNYTIELVSLPARGPAADSNLKPQVTVDDVVRYLTLHNIPRYRIYVLPFLQNQNAGTSGAKSNDSNVPGVQITVLAKTEQAGEPL